MRCMLKLSFCTCKKTEIPAHILRVEAKLMEETSSYTVTIGKNKNSQSFHISLKIDEKAESVQGQ